MDRTGDAARRVHRAYAWALEGQIHYRRSGPAGARSPLLLLHGLDGPGARFEEFMSEMGRERSVIAPDLPGTGMSDALPGKPDPAAHAGVMLQLVATLGLGMVDVVAVKGGGEIALEMARQKPDVVRRIVLVSAAPPSGLLSQPILALDMPGFPEESPDAAAAMREFLDR